ncbi:MAG: hypothetical protein IPN38_17200 [Flavobacteriales bacterium]|nr:hypothetical protein [Flavobacteriales bacterium]
MGRPSPDASGTWNIGIEGKDGYRLYLNDSLVIDRWADQSFHTTLVPHTFTENEHCALRIEYRERAGNARFKLVHDEKVSGASDMLEYEGVR